MEQIFADRAVAFSRARDFAEVTDQPHYVIALTRDFAVCDAAGLKSRRPATYSIVERHRAT